MINRIRKSAWPIINGPDDVPAAWPVFGDLAEQHSTQTGRFDQAAADVPFPHRGYTKLLAEKREAQLAERRRRANVITEHPDDHPSERERWLAHHALPAPPATIHDLLNLLRPLAAIPDQVEPTTELLGADDFQRDENRIELNIPGYAISVDHRPLFAYWTNRLALDQLNAARDGVSRSEVRDLAQHVNGPLTDAVAQEIRNEGLFYGHYVAAIDQQFSAAERGSWAWPGLDLLGDEPAHEPPPPIPAELR